MSEVMINENENENTNNGILENNNSIKNESSNLEFLENLKVKTKKYQRDEHLNKINKLLKDINEDLEIKDMELMNISNMPINNCEYYIWKYIDETTIFEYDKNKNVINDITNKVDLDHINQTNEWKFKEKDEGGCIIT
jgi:hypothetical protein